MLGLLLFWGFPALMAVLSTSFFCRYRMTRGKPVSFEAAFMGGLSAALFTMIFANGYFNTLRGFIYILVFVAPPSFVTAWLVVVNYRHKIIR